MSHDSQDNDPPGGQRAALDADARTVSGAADAARGDLTGLVGSAASALGAVASGIGEALPTGEAKEALKTAGTAAKAAGDAVKAAQALGSALQSGDLGRAAGGLGSATDAARYIVPDDQVRDVLGAANQVGGALRQGEQALDALGGALSGQRNDDVEFHVEVSGAEGRWGLTSVTLNEGLNLVPTCVIDALYSESITPRELLYKECSLTIERREQRRSFKGIVWSATVRDATEGTTVQLHVRPAAALLGKKLGSKIFQDMTVVQVIESVYQALLGNLQRTIRNDTQRTYETREYIVQYQETGLDFIRRLAEEEGIFWYFDFEDEKETLVLVDTSTGLLRARPDHDGQVEYHRDPAQAPDGEAAWAVEHYEEIGTTDAVVGDFNWTHPQLTVRAEQTGRSDHQPALELYDHTDALIFHQYNGEKYEGDTSTIQARLRAEQLDLARQRWEMSTSVVTALPGHLIELVNAPDGDLDQQYLIVSASARGSATEGAAGSWENHLELVPASIPYRPARRTPRPVVHGPETAIVTTRSGQEIDTDEHGRVKVYFHWDRDFDREAADTSCWIRVAHNWAGSGFGSFFLPRKGMEVVVSFLGGNPDRPLITGCIYNGENASPAAPLPAKKTQTVIRTKSSPNSDGFNELRFEDEAGKEFIFTHAQKDYNEVVENNHSTHVKNNQTNTVDVDQTETVGRDQTMTVKRDRTKTVDGTETTYVGGGETPGHRLETVWGNEEVTINQNRTHTVVKDETLTVTEGKRTVTVETGKDTETYNGGRETTVLQFDNLTVDGGANRNTHVTGQYNITSDGHFKIIQNSINELTIDDAMFAAMLGRIQLKAGDGVHYDATPDGTLTVKAKTKIVLECGGAKLEMSSDGTVKITGSTIEVAGGGSAVKLDSSGATMSGAKVTSSASGVNEITGALVKIN